VDKILWDYHTIESFLVECFQSAMCIARVLPRRNFLMCILIVINGFQNILVRVTVESRGSLSLLSNNIHVVIQTFFLFLAEAIQVYI